MLCLSQQSESPPHAIDSDVRPCFTPTRPGDSDGSLVRVEFPSLQLHLRQPPTPDRSEERTLIHAPLTSSSQSESSSSSQSESSSSNQSESS